MTAKGYTTEEGNRLNNFAVEPKMYVDESSQAGFTVYAQKLNGRLAMVGFILNVGRRPPIHRGMNDDQHINREARLKD
jgi:hypothetical protein